MKSRMWENYKSGSVRGELSFSYGTNIVTLPEGNRKQTGNTKPFLRLRDTHLLDKEKEKIQKKLDRKKLKSD